MLTTHHPATDPDGVRALVPLRPEAFAYFAPTVPSEGHLEWTDAQIIPAPSGPPGPTWLTEPIFMGMIRDFGVPGLGLPS